MNALGWHIDRLQATSLVDLRILMRLKNYMFTSALLPVLPVTGQSSMGRIFAMPGLFRMCCNILMNDDSLPRASIIFW